MDKDGGIALAKLRRQYRVTQSGNRVELHGGRDVIFYEVDGIALPPVRDVSFAVWHILASAMLVDGEDAELVGPVDPVVIANAEQFSRAWEMWRPREYRAVSIVGGAPVARAQDRRDGRLVLYSGGLDSADMLLRLGPQSPRGAALTIQGMDYGVDAHEKFAKLLAMGQPLLDDLGYDRITIRTNLQKIARGVHSYALALAGCAFLLSDLYKSAAFAADFNRIQDLAIVPWGSNYVSNDYLVGTDFALDALNEHLTRTEKAALIAGNEAALRTVSFCKRQDLRPRNCGRCSKCMRTKLMFAATIGRQPDIFIDPTFDASIVKRADLSQPIERAFFIDLFQVARANGRLAEIPGLSERFEHDLRRTPVMVQAANAIKRLPKKARGYAGAVRRRLVAARAA